MLLSNIQDNIIKAPMVQAAQAAVGERDRVENALQRREALEKARLADEYVQETHAGEHEAIRRERQGEEEVQADGRRKRSFSQQQEKSDAEEEEAQGQEPKGNPRPALPPTLEGRHLDITA